MGNCQAIDAATLVIQYPSGKAENFYWPVSASEVMKMNPGHYVALLLSTNLYPTNNNGECPANTTANNTPLRVTRIKLLRPTDTLVLGHVYRLITTQGLSYLLVYTSSLPSIVFEFCLIFLLGSCFFRGHESFMCKETS